MADTDYQAVPVEDGQPAQQSKKPRSFLAAVMLTICIVSFVVQTEITQYVQRTSHYQKPYFILWISHCCYVMMIPIQFLAECLVHYKHHNGSLSRHIKDTAKDCKVVISKSLSDLQQRAHSSAHPFIFSGTIIVILAILLTIPSYLWYVSVNLTSMANLTAIYNTGCFFAYLFSILMLGDKVTRPKVAAVVLCMTGVFAMAYGAPSTEEASDSSDSTDTATSSVIGILVALLGAAAYGFYEVYYKKHGSPSKPTILFANTVTGCIGLATFLVLWIPLPLLHWSGHELFQLPDLQTFLNILCIASMSAIYNATFMCVIAIVNPVFAAVGVMLTVPAVAVTDVLVTGVMVPLSTILGSALILIGFYILNTQVNQEQSA